MDVVIYGRGAFYEENKERIQLNNNVVAIVDKNACISEEDKGVYKNIELVKQTYDMVIVMISRIDFLFEVVHMLVNKVNYKRIKLGIALYGQYNLCDDISVGNKGQICITSKSYVEAWNESEFYQYMKELLLPRIKEQNSILEEKLIQNYENMLAITWNGEQPLSHNHDVDLYSRFPKFGIFDWGEIATFNLRAIYQFKKKYILDLGCADGFYYKRFYSFIKDVKYVGVDSDAKNIENAKVYDSTTCKFICSDFIKEYPFADLPEYYTNVICNSTMQMFNDDELTLLLYNIKNSLTDEGIFSGTASLKTEIEGWKYCINPFNSVEELSQLLHKFFTNVFVYNDDGMPGRIMFMASEKQLPFIGIREGV